MKKEHLAVLSKILLSAAVILIPCGYARAQKLKYVTFFPIPFGSHSEIFVKNKAILGAGHNAEIIFKDTINLAADQQGNPLGIMELNLSPLLENGATDNNDIPIVALEGGIYTAKIETQNNAYSFNKTKESFFKLGGSSGNAIKFDSSDFKFIADSAIDYTVHSDTLNMGEKNSYTKPLLFHNANNGNIGEIETSDCRRFCWVQIKLPREKEFKYYLACHNADKCPATGFEPVNKVEPKYYNFYALVDGGKGFFVEGEYEGVKIPFAFSTASMGEINNVDASYHLNLTPAVTYYYSERGDWELPELTIEATQSLLAKIPPYNLLVPLGLGFELSSDITITLPAPPISDNPSNGVVKIDLPPDCPAGASGETICLKAQAKDYRCIRKTLYNPSINTKITQMKIDSLITKTAENGAGEVTLHHRKKWPFKWTNQSTVASVDYCLGIPQSILFYELNMAICVGSEIKYAAEDTAYFCCPTLLGTQSECLLKPALSYSTKDKWACKSTDTRGCRCNHLTKDANGWQLAEYKEKYFFFRLKYYTPQWEDVATMIECQNTEYKADGLY